MFNLFKVAIIITISIVGILLVFGLLLGIIEKRTTRNLVKRLGPKVIVLTGIVGTTIHELSHLIMSLIFRHRVENVKLFSINLKSETLGYVNHSYNKKSYYQRAGNFFIGVAPILIGTAIIILLFRILVPNSWSNAINEFGFSGYLGLVDSFSIQKFIDLLLNSSWGIITSLFSVDNITSFKFWIFIILAISICMHMELSPADFKGAIDGIIFIFILSLIVSLILVLVGVSISTILSYVMIYNVFIIAFLVFSLIFSMIGYIVSIFVGMI